MSNILVIGELLDGQPQPITGELMRAARSLSLRSGQEVGVVFTVDTMTGIDQDSLNCGADKSYLVEHPLLSCENIEAHVSALEQVCKEINPSVILAGKTGFATDAVPRLAFKLGVGLAQDCVGLDVDDENGNVVATRPVYGGNALARFRFTDIEPQVCLIRNNVFDSSLSEVEDAWTIQRIDVELDNSLIRTKLVEVVRRQSTGVKLEDAAIVIGGGRGLGGPEAFDQLNELAELLGGAVGASRAVCDAGWLDHDHQIGLTGKTISPDLYIMIAISGASQHMAGCSGAKNIVAINKDIDANIFREARFGVVGDWEKIFPSFVETTRELINS